uniref:FAD synthase middle domain-containing protein n=1 Tax=Timema douglasi TaxID=61478 RepID=A0A7R8VRQ3_TIMDO|nr:unnamed protein product [Timema douglasi]
MQFRLKQPQKKMGKLTLQDGYYKVRVTVESDSQEELYKAYNKLLSVLEQGKSIFFRNKNLSLWYSR